MNNWGGASRVNSVYEVTKKQTLSKVKLKKGDFVIAHEHAGDHFFYWLLLSKNTDGKLVIAGTHPDYTIANTKQVGVVTKESLASLLNEYYNYDGCGSFLSYNKEEN